MPVAKILMVLGAGFIFNSYAQCIAEQNPREFTAVGVVKNTQGDVVYEEHYDNKGELAQVNYITPDGKVIAIKTIDYECRISAPNYVLQMKQGSNWTERVKWENGQLIVIKPEGQKALQVITTDDLVIDAGFDNYIYNNWQALLSGQQKEINFLHVPGKRLIKLIVNQVSTTMAEEFTGSDDIAVFEITTKSRLLRLFSKAIYLGYDKTTKQLDFYSGPTNSRGTVEGLDKSRQVVINYQYN